MTSTGSPVYLLNVERGEREGQLIAALRTGSKSAMKPMGEWGCRIVLHFVKTTFTRLRSYGM